MNTIRKPVMILLVGLIVVTAGSSLAFARGPHGQGPDHGGMESMMNPEAYALVEKDLMEAAPLRMELRAKKDELTAKIYQNADDMTIDKLAKEIASLQARLTQSHIKIQKQLAANGVPLHIGHKMSGFGGKMHKMPPCFGPDGGPGPKDKPFAPKPPKKD